MRAVVTRVSRADVEVDGRTVARIGAGLLALVAATHDDDRERAGKLARKIAGIRILSGERSVLETGGEVLVVSQFTLYASTDKGRRPSWSAAAPGPVAEPLVQAVADELRALGVPVATGVFGATMAVTSTNDGPITLILQT